MVAKKPFDQLSNIGESVRCESLNPLLTPSLNSTSSILIDRPLFVDLDGTLIHGDLLVESFIEMVKRHPLACFKVPFWLSHGKAVLKQRIATLGPIDAKLLPYNLELLDFLRQQAEQGRPIYLATASNRLLADAVADHLGIFRAVLASDDKINLSGKHKLAAILATTEATASGFDYAGNEAVDIPIWNASQGAIVVNGAPGLVKRIDQSVNIVAQFKRPANRVGALAKAARPHQWLKNLLVFLPLLPLATTASMDMLTATLLAFVAYSLCASSVYLVNDLADLPADRAHPRKRRRPFASGNAVALHGLLLAPLLLLAAAAACIFLPANFSLVLGLYLVTTTAYTFFLKRYALIDVVTLAALYTLRVIGGAAAIAVAPSFWILAFSMFLFFSLALAKRHAELFTMRMMDVQSMAGRGYHPADLQTVQQMGISTGYLAVLVMALYINSAEIVARYGQVKWLWGVLPLLALWVSRIWLKAGRGEMTDDPLVFAVKDKVSRLVAVLAGLIVVAALFLH